ncbi:MAG: dipeptidase [Proteocatella sp.]
MKLFDLHCDSITEYKKLNSDFLCKETHFSLTELYKFEKLCQTMAIFIPDEYRGLVAFDYFDSHIKYLKNIVKKQNNIVEIAYNAGDIYRITNEKKAALIIAIEGGAAIAGRLENIDYISNCGVRLMTLVWNGENEIASGHNTNNGFSKFGKEAVKRLEEKNIIIDVSHLNDSGFEELCSIAKKPFIATHSNLREICRHKRNLTNAQFEEIIKRKGIVGINLYELFLSDDGIGDRDSVYRHIYKMLELGGEDTIACGSDFDGADIHCSLNTPVKFGGMADYLLERGIKKNIIDKIFYDNAYNFFKNNLE